MLSSVISQPVNPKIKRKKRINVNNSLRAALLLGVTLISGCAVSPCCIAPVAVTVGPCGAAVCAPTSTVARKLLATGYGNIGSYAHYTSGQAKLMAMRAAKVDAYRNLAEQVQGVRVWGNTAVSSFVAQNDTVRTYVDSFIRGARAVSVTEIGDGNYEATVELELTPTFLDCFAATGHCGAAYHTSYGIVPSVNYTTH
jgi:hypothetical protein